MEPSVSNDEVRYRALELLDPDRPDQREGLLQALSDESWRVRRRAAERLATAAEKAKVGERLVALLRTAAEPAGRNAAIEALAALGDPAAPFAIALLEDPEGGLRKLAADVLGRLDAKVAKAPLLAALSDPDANVRVSAAEALGRLGDPGCAHELEKRLEDGVAWVRLAALEAMTQLGIPPPLPRLVALAKEPPLRRAALGALALIKQPAALEELTQALRTGPDAHRLDAVAALGRQLSDPDRRWVEQTERLLKERLKKSAEVGAVLRAALGQDELEVRVGALRLAAALGASDHCLEIAQAASDERLGEVVVGTLSRLGPGAGHTLLSHFSSLPPEAQWAAADALSSLVEASMVAPLRALVPEVPPAIQVLLVRALGQTRAKEAVEALGTFIRQPELAKASARALVSLSGSFPLEVQKALEGAVGFAGGDAVVALAQVGGERALHRLRSLARHPEPAVRRAVVAAVAELGAESLDLVRIALSDESTAVRAEAARALGKVGRGEPELEALLGHALSDPEDEVRAAALDGVREGGLRHLSVRAKEALAARQGVVALAALRTLGELGELDGTALVVAARHPDAEVVREALVWGAALNEGPHVAVALLGHPSWAVRAQAARLLGDCAGAEAQAPIEHALVAEADPLCREALERALRELQRRHGRAGP